MQPWKPQEPQNFDVLMFSQLAGHGRFDQCDGDACDKIDDEPALEVLHKYHFVICDQSAILVVIVCAKACHYDVSEEHEISNYIYDDFPVARLCIEIVLLECDEIWHQKCHIEEEQDNED